ncbi:MAG: CvpA family protein [Desulfovibrio sp.]|jgi:membrane protein required for colicin V production|nr:CvpA family protein [Desulfovibrio sp.]
MESKDIFDLAIVLTMVFFIVRGYFNGFIGEVAGIVSIVAGLGAAHNFSDRLSPNLTVIADPGFRNIAAYVVILVAVMIVVAVIARVLQKVINFSFAAGADRLCGAGIGFIKGTILCALVLLMLRKFFADAVFMTQSRVLPYFDAIVEQMRSWLPPDLLTRVGM